MSSFSHFRDVTKMIDPHLAREQLLHQALFLGFEGVELLSEKFDFPVKDCESFVDPILFCDTG